jgi:hypothetical protein
MAMACLRLFTRCPERPERSWPRFISCIAFSTFLPAFGPYRRPLPRLALRPRLERLERLVLRLELRLEGRLDVRLELRLLLLRRARPVRLRPLLRPLLVCAMEPPWSRYGTTP